MPFDRARRYINAVPPAAAGNRNDSLNKLAFQVLERFRLDQADFESLMLEWAGGCTPPIPDGEAMKTIHSAWHGANGKGAVGSKARATLPAPSRNGKIHPSPKSAKIRYDLDGGQELPEPIDDGARVIVQTLFEPGEGIRIVNAKLDDEKGGEVPDGSGPCLSREEWLRKLDKANGNPNSIFSSSKKTGIYIAINPLKVGGSKDTDVTAYRHALVEFDDGLSPEEQFNLYLKSKIPCAAIIYSGGKSVHAWVKVGAGNRQEYDERVKQLYSHFESAGYMLDTKNKNPGRLSRLPNCVRFERRQELLALNTGCESFTEWLTNVQADGIGKTTTFKEVFEYDAANDNQTVLGNRWLCRGGSCLLIGPSGVGKSSLVLQFAICWALGRPAFGIKPSKALKVLVVQAENDDGDVHEAVAGVCEGLGVSFDEPALSLLSHNLVFNRNMSHTGQPFTEALRRLIDRHKPDLVILDPLLSFIGADISRQEVCSQFLRNWLNPIAEATGVVWFCVHHTGKPSTDPKSKKHWQQADYSYSGIGSSELTNWTRATLVLEQAGGPAFRLMLTKRGKRAGATHPDGSPTHTLWLRQSDKAIFWEQQEAPEEPAEAEVKKPQGRPKAEWDLVQFLTSISGEAFIRKDLKSRACQFGEFSGSHFEHVVWPILKAEMVQDGKLWRAKK